MPWRLDGEFDAWSALPAGAFVTAAVIVGIAAFHTGGLPRVAFALPWASALTLVPTLSIVLPRVEALWIARGLDDRLTARPGATRSSRIAATGFHEPSLVFHFGEDAALVSARRAAGMLVANEVDAALVEQAIVPAFLEHLAGVGAAVERVAEQRGFNYSKGEWVSVVIYVRLEPH